jgi:hypothetical protein
MYREITVGKESVPMKATAATPIRYRHVFKKDVLNELSTVGENSGLAVDTISQLAFIMAKAASGADMNKLNEDEYVAWLEQFEPFDITNASEDIVDLYVGNTKGMSEVKKKAGDAVSES